MIAGPAPAIAQQYNIVDYGAKNDTGKLSTEAINNAIAACNSKGGGKVVIPAGNYKSGTIVLKSNVELHLKLTSLVEVHPWIMTFEGEAYPIAPPELLERHTCTGRKRERTWRRMGCREDSETNSRPFL